MSSCPSQSCRSPRLASPFSKQAREFAQRAAAVADRMLLVRRQFGERAPVAAVGDEDRVVAEAAITMRFCGDRAIDPAVGDEFGAVGKAGDHDRAKPRGALLVG